MEKSGDSIAPSPLLIALEYTLTAQVVNWLAIAVHSTLLCILLGSNMHTMTV